MTLFRLAVAASLAAGISAVSVAQTVVPALDVKSGLWEVTTTVNVDNPLAGTDASKLPPQVRAQIEARMKSMTAPQTSRTCITRESLQKGFTESQQNSGNCKDTVTSNTSKAFEMQRVCTGDRQGTTTFHFEAVSPEAVTGKFNSTTVRRGDAQNVNGTIAGKWVANDCGDIKPGDAKPAK